MTSTPTASSSAPVSGQPATHTRYWVVAFAISLAMIQYIDRACLAQVQPEIMGDLSLSNEQWGYINSAFALAYALFEIPTGWLGDRIGARKVLTRVVLWWSVFTAAVGAAWNAGSLMVIRFLFGAGEAGCFPNLTKAFSTWLPRRERTRIQGVMWMGARWGGAMAPLLIVLVMAFMNLSWRWAFVVFAALGAAWAAIFWWWFRDNPKDHPRVNATELELLRENQQNAAGHGNVPWGVLLSRPSVWLLWLQYFCLSYGWYFYITWLPKYLKDQRSMDFKSNAVLKWLADHLERSTDGAHGWFTHAQTGNIVSATLAGIPLFCGGIGCLFSGWLISRLIAKGGRPLVVRRSFGVIGLAGAGTLLLGSFYVADPLWAMLAMGAASFFNDLSMPGSWASCMDIGGKYAGTVSGSMNMMGNFGGVAFPAAAGLILAHSGQNWWLVFASASAIYFIGAVCWLFINPVTPLEQSAEPSHA
jgi:MFS family permease